MHRLVIALTTLLGLTGAAVVAGYLFVFSASTDRAAAIAPANTAFYANVYLQPSTGQRMNLGELIGRLPGFADDANLDDKIDQIVERLLAQAGIDYQADVKPWLGDQISIAAWPGEQDPTDGGVVVIAAVTDVATAQTALADRAAKNGTTPSTEMYRGVELTVAGPEAHAFVNEMLVMGPDPEAVSAVIDASGDATALGDEDAFVAAMDALPADHLASFYVDLAGLAEQGGVEDSFADSTTASAVLVAEEDGLRLSGSAPFDVDAAEASAKDRFALGTEPSSLVGWMPDETIAEVVVFGLRRTLEDAEAAAQTTPEGEQLGSALDQLRAIAAFGLGIDLDADVLPLLDREVGVALTGIEGGTPTGVILLRPDDIAAARDALSRVVERLSAAGATTNEDEIDGTTVTTLELPDTVELSYAVTDRLVVIGLRPDDVAATIAAHADGTSLSGTDLYRRTFDVAGARAGTEGFVAVGPLVELLGIDAGLPPDARDILSQVGSFGFTVPSREDQIEFHAVVTVEPAENGR